MWQLTWLTSYLLFYKKQLYYFTQMIGYWIKKGEHNHCLRKKYINKENKMSLVVKQYMQDDAQRCCLGMQLPRFWNTTCVFLMQVYVFGVYSILCLTWESGRCLHFFLLRNYGSSAKPACSAALPMRPSMLQSMMRYSTGHDQLSAGDVCVCI